LTCDRVRLQNQLEALLEDAQIKLSSCVSDLLGLSSRRIPQALGQGESDPAVLATLAAPGSAGHPRTVMSASQKPGLQPLVWRRSRSEYVRRHGKWPTFRRMRCGEEKFLWRRQAGDFHVLVSLDLREPSKKHAI
jgi:hypothetical protein